MNSRRDVKNFPIGRSVACYFCNEFFEEKYLQDHIIQCSSVLEACPKRCGAYIQRSTKEKHILECRRIQRPKSTYDLLMKQPGTNIELENELMTLRSVISEEKRLRQEQQIELNSLQKLYRKTEEFNKHLTTSLEQLKRTCFEETEKNKTQTTQIKLEIDKILLQYQILDSWKKHIDSNTEFAKNRLIEFENKLLDTEFTINKHAKRIDTLDHLEMELNMLYQKLNDAQFEKQEESFAWRSELNEFKQFFAQENAMIAALWTDQRDELNKFKEKLDGNEIALNEFQIKYQSLVFDTKSVGQIANESSEVLDSQNGELKMMKNTIEQMKIDFKDLEQLITNKSTNTIHDGRLLWKIDNYKEKMETAKNNNTVLHSPIFYSSPYGYKLRIELFLNGIKKWRGRHIILSLQVLKGDWDPLLNWPCVIEAKVILKNLTDPRAKDTIKYITAKRLVGDEVNEDPQESSSQYIFITHATVEKHTFIKDNTMFLEVKIINDNATLDKKSVEVTTL